jgi:hypothetical protein
MTTVNLDEFDLPSLDLNHSSLDHTSRSESSSSESDASDFGLGHFGFNSYFSGGRNESSSLRESSSSSSARSSASSDDMGVVSSFSPRRLFPVSAVSQTVSVSAPSSSPAKVISATSAATTATKIPSWIATLSDSVLKSDMTTIANSGVVTEGGLAKMMADLSGELTSTKTTLSASQFADLKTITANLNNGLTASAYQTYTLGALVNGNAANAYWTGGSTTASTLGNLKVGSTVTQLTQLTGKWLLGTDLPSSSVTMSPTKLTFQYQTNSNSLFGASGPSVNDINQGYLGDCYLLSTLAEVASQHASAITSMITNNGNNTYGVRFYVNGQAQYVTVSNTLAAGGNLFNSGTNIWGSIVEQGYAQLQAGGNVTGNTRAGSTNSFTSIGNGGYPAYALEEITGASAITSFYGNGSSWTGYVQNASMNYISSTSNISSSSLLSTLVSDLAAGDDLILSSYTNATDSAGKTTLVASHAMSIYGYNSKTGNLQIRNPWGTMKGQSWDTTFEVSLSTLLSAGDVITVDNVGGTPKATTSSPSALAATASSVSSSGPTVSALSSSVSSLVDAMTSFNSESASSASPLSLASTSSSASRSNPLSVSSSSSSALSLLLGQYASDNNAVSNANASLQVASIPSNLEASSLLLVQRQNNLILAAATNH